MKISRRQLFVLTLAFALVVAFVVSFVITLRSDTPRVTATVGNGPALPSINSGKRVEVLNGSGRSGLARQATDQLRTAGFDVVFLGNAPKQEKSSVALDRVGKIELARAVAKTLGIARVESSRDTTRLVEVSVILGTDWVPPGHKR